MTAPHDYEVPRAPVRDDDALAADEDLDREPDGVPHAVVGFTAFFSVLLAMLVAFMFLTHNTAAQIAAVVLALIAIPVLVSTLRKRADVHRDHLHPSR
jgi:Kef-type K+ transport system membrane component KefB